MEEIVFLEATVSFLTYWLTFPDWYIVFCSFITNLVQEVENENKNKVLKKVLLSTKKKSLPHHLNFYCLEISIKSSILDRNLDIHSSDRIRL